LIQIIPSTYLLASIGLVRPLDLNMWFCLGNFKHAHSRLKLAAELLVRRNSFSPVTARDDEKGGLS
jgi:hypothetical protein